MVDMAHSTIQLKKQDFEEQETVVQKRSWPLAMDSVRTDRVFAVSPNTVRDGMNFSHGMIDIEFSRWAPMFRRK